MILEECPRNNSRRTVQTDLFERRVFQFRLRIIYVESAAQPLLLS